jgi:hypothetical protein
MKISRQTLSSLLLVTVLVVAIVTLLFAASISYKQIQSLNNSGKWILQSYKFKNELKNFYSFAKDAESSQRAYLLSDDSIFLKSYFSALDSANVSIDRLRLLSAGNFQQTKHLDTLVRVLDRRFGFLESILKTNNHKVPTSDTLKSKIIIGRRLMKLAQNQVDTMIVNESRLLRSREKTHEKYIIFSPFSILFVVLLSLFVFVLAYIKINKDLKRLTETNNQLLINKKIFEHSEQIAGISNWYLDIEENKLIYSKNQYLLFGCEPYEFEPTIENFLMFVHPEDRQVIIDRNQKSLEDSVAHAIYFRVIRKDGALRYFRSDEELITDNYGKSFIIGINADITEQYRKDKVIENKIADLEKSNNELLAFNHIASHDLQEPLRKVRTFISRIREHDFEIFSENVKEYFSGIDRATIRMQNFIADLLLYSQANNIDKVFELTDLNLLLEISISELSQRLEEKNATVKTLSLLPVLNVIPFQMQQFFNNIISNSIKYSKPDIKPVISIDARIVSGGEINSPHAKTDTKYHKISISDNGIGFEQEQAEAIFKLFYRLHGKTEYSGTGVGLAICKIIADNHNGFIRAEGIPDVGTTIILYLPA